MRKGQKITAAQNLRRRQTDAEQTLWRLLRNRSLSGAKFRRQHAIGRYIVDFICLESNLIIELDGGQHALNVEADLARTAELQLLGFEIIRIWNNEMLANPEGVLRMIEEAIKPPSPQPSPASGRGSSTELVQSPRPLAGEGGTHRKAVGG